MFSRQKYLHYLQIFRMDSLSKKLAVSYIVLIVTIVILIGITSYDKSNYTIQDETKRLISGMLHQTVNSTDMILNEIFLSSMRLTYNNDIVEFIEDKGNEQFKYQNNLINMGNLVKNILNSSKYVDSICIYSVDKGKVFSSKNAIIDSNTYPDINIMKKMLMEKQSFIKLKTRNIITDYFSTDKSPASRNIISILVSYPIGNSKKKGVIQYNVNETTFYNMVKDLYPDKKGKFFILDQDNSVITHSDKNMLYADLTNESYIQKISSCVANEGMIIEEIDNKKCAIFFSTSTVSNWKFITTIPMDIYMNPANILKYTFIMLGIFVYI